YSGVSSSQNIEGVPVDPSTDFRRSHFHPHHIGAPSCESFHTLRLSCVLNPEIFHKPNLHHAPATPERDQAMRRISSEIGIVVGHPSLSYRPGPPISPVNPDVPHHRQIQNLR